MTKAYKEGDTYSARMRRDGHDIYLTGFKTKHSAEVAVVAKFSEIVKSGRPLGKGPTHSSLAAALQDYGRERLPFLKGATQDARRINKYLRAAGYDLIEVTRLEEASPEGAYFVVRLTPHTSTRVVPKGLHHHRKKLLTKTADSSQHFASLATKKVSEITRHDLQGYMNAMRLDGYSASSVALERAFLRGFFNHARTHWTWASLADNPATGLKMPPIDNARERVLSLEEQTRLDIALQDCRNAIAGPVFTLLRETAMRASEPLEHATWSDVDWERKVIKLKDSKQGKRDVPLSAAAIQALKDLQPGAPKQRIVRISYESMRAAWRRACERAGIKGLRLHDLRHTAATRMALKTGNIFLVKALTGHKTLEMVARYVNVGADDVVKAMEAADALVSLGAVSMSAEDVQKLVSDAVAAAVEKRSESVQATASDIQEVQSPAWRNPTGHNVFELRRAV